MKKSLRLLAIGIVMILMITGCQKEDNAEIIVVPDYSSEVEDWGLYSWQEDGEWVFSIVDRYGGYETIEEISVDEYRLDGLDVLVEALLHLPENAELLWTENVIPGTVLPPNDLLYQILDYCNTIGVPVIVMN